MISYIKHKLKWEEPLGLTIITAIVTGSFVTTAPPPGARKFLFCLSCYHTTMFVLFMFSAVTNIFVATDFFGECLESMHFLVTGLHLFFKYLTMRIRERDFLELFHHIQAVWGTYRVHHEEFLSKALSSTNAITVIIFVTIINVMSVNIIAAYLKNIIDPETVHFPLQIWIPPFLRESFLTGSIAQALLFYSPLIIICMTTSFLNSISAHVEAIGLALAQDIRQQKEWSDQNAKQFYKKHQEVIRIVLRVNALMAGNWGFELLCSSLQLTLPAYRTLRALKRNEIEVFNHAFILFLNFMVIFLIFSSGNRILSMGEAIHNSIYETKWYESSVKGKKNVLFAIFRATKPIEYKYKIVHFDLPGFTKVVNTVFSYMALLRFLDDAGDTNEGLL